MSVCVFFGHRECYGLGKERIRQAVEKLIAQGADTFYVGNQGLFDGYVCDVLKDVSAIYPHIYYAVVLAYLPGQKKEHEDLSNSIFPEGMENGPPRFAIDRRNRWMIDQADQVICYVQKTWGGAYNYVRLARKKGKVIHNLGKVQF